MTRTLYAATTNRGKLAEFVHCASPAGIVVEALPGLEAMPEPIEDAATFAGNAAIKAIAYSRLAPGTCVLADDSGLEVAALDGRPGVRSARFADDLGFTLEGASKDERNNLALLSLLPHGADRAARFVCALAVAQDGRIVAMAEGSCDGVLLTLPRGANGFGYDPLLLVPRFDRTMAELTREEKWSVSHRGAAFRNLMKTLPHERLEGNE